MDTILATYITRKLFDNIDLQIIQLSFSRIASSLYELNFLPTVAPFCVTQRYTSGKIEQETGPQKLGSWPADNTQKMSNRKRALPSFSPSVAVMTLPQSSLRAQ